MYRGELAPGHPAFPAGSEAACIEADAPLSNVKDLKYSPEDDAAIENKSASWLAFMHGSPPRPTRAARLALDAVSPSGRTTHGAECRYGGPDRQSEPLDSST
ncbi:hypothetical protein BGZ61DRAFT_486609 [Ilyonectria robusta]|uniref:uncharacterized protein n=1 Tax=Ilyonectria robusta TaxID=1079257 RepID=UPI001E8E2CF6|nr:uncharacterized protein BGZ61DRAFT_486609 [Ilyonectria robusta]KAH8656382.1 hypothetical protein BGZ61DRAFT_486609 [Ilyonectria robusta]